MYFFFIDKLLDRHCVEMIESQTMMILTTLGQAIFGCFFIPLILIALL